VQDPVGIDDQRAVAIRVKPQVDARFFAHSLAAVVIESKLRISDFRFLIENPFQHLAPVKSLLLK
jgi:hypothetical protein